MKQQRVLDYLEKIRLLSIETTEFLEHKDLNEFSNDPPVSG